MWLGYVGERGWHAVTRNKDIRYTQIERDAVMIAGVGLFVMRGKWTHRDLAQGFVTNLPRIFRFLGKHPPPFIANVSLLDSSGSHSDHSAPASVSLILSVVSQVARLSFTSSI